MKILTFLFSITLFSIFFGIKVAFPDTYLLLIREDSVIEYVQALFYLLSSVLAVLVSIRFIKTKLTLHAVLYGILAVALLFVSLEEISWGQRIFNLTTPDYLIQHNYQHEISFHNLKTVQRQLAKVYICVGCYGAFAWLLVKLFFSKAKTRNHNIVNFIVPEWFVSSYFFFVFLIYTIFEYIARPYTGGFLLWRDQEPAELFLSLGFLSFVVSNYLRLRTGVYASVDDTEE